MIGLLCAAVFILLNAFFVAAEFAFVKTRATQIASKVAEGNPQARLAQQILGRLDRYLSATQFGVTLASLGLGWIGEPAIEHVVVGWIGEEQIAERPGLRAAVIIGAFTLLTFAHVLFGELVPKLIAIQRSERTALTSARALHLMYIACRPLLWVLERASGVVLRLMGLSASTASEGALSEEEILGILVAHTANAPGGAQKRRLLERVMSFADHTAKHAMVPRVDVVFLPIDSTPNAALALLREQEYSRVPLTTDRSIDHVVGYLYTKDFFLDERADDRANLKGFRRDVLYVPEAQGLLDVLEEMQKSQIPFAVVVDEYGGTSGILTVEDIVEEIFGEIRDELDEEPARWTPVDREEGAWDVDAGTAMSDLRELGVVLDGERDPAEPVATAMLEAIGRVPRRGDRAKLGKNAWGAVESVSRRRITRVRLRLGEMPVGSLRPPSA